MATLMGTLVTKAGRNAIVTCGRAALVPLEFSVIIVIDGTIYARSLAICSEEIRKPRSRCLESNAMMVMLHLPSSAASRLPQRMSLVGEASRSEISMPLMSWRRTTHAIDSTSRAPIIVTTCRSIDRPGAW
jgi:hypothetical protein